MKNYYEEDQKLFTAVTSFMEGNQESYYVMYDLSIKYIYKIVFDIIKDHHATEDLVQETYLTIYKKIDTLDDVSKFYAWAGRIATNHTFRYISKNKRELLTLDSEDGESEFAFEVATQDNEEFIPENILMDKEKQRLIAQIVDGLSTEQKLAVQYFYYEEMSVTEIAETMGCARGTIMSRLNYARKAIKAAVVDLAENKGTKLYSLGALPLFRMVFRYSVESFILPATASGIVTEVGSALGTTVARGTTAIEAAETVGSASMGTTAGVGTVVGTEAATGAVAEAGVAAGAGIVAETGVAAGAGAAAGTGAVGVMAKTVASGVTKGILGKLGASLGVKIAAGVLAAGLLTTGGIILHNAITNDDSDTKEKDLDTTPMVVCLESESNKESLDITDDRFAYEYLNVIYNDTEMTVGFDGNIYQFGYDSYDTLSPELKELHDEVYEEAITVEEKELKKIFDKEIEFTIDDKEFVLHVEDVEVEYNAEKGTTTIVITGDCETPKNVDDIYEKYCDRYKETFIALAEREATIQTEWDAGQEVAPEPTPELITESTFEDYVIIWYDANLENRMREVTGIYGRDIMYSDVKDITELNLSSIDVWVDSEKIKDISALSNLTSLITLDLSYNRISNLSALSSLTNLSSLCLECNDISDINALGSLINLTELNLADNDISDLSALSSLTSLIYLNLNSNKVSDITALSGLVRLEELDLSYNSISDLSALSSLTNLTFLSLSRVAIDNVNALGSLINLTELHMYGNNLSDITALSNLTNLTSLYLHDNDINDITALSNLTNLEDLSLDDNNISDLSALSSLTNLKYLKIQKNKFTEISALSNLMNLESLYLSNSNISELGALSNLISLEILMLSNNSITDINALSNLMNLKCLYLDNNSVTDISALSNLMNLETLQLANNSVNDISALSNLMNLQYLYLYGNNVTDYSPVNHVLEVY